MIYASEKARFGQPEVKLGIIPGFGGCERLSRLIGPARAKEMIYSGEHYSAQKAKEIGLALEIFPPDQLLPEVKKIAGKIAKNGPLAVAQAKRAIVRGFNADLHVANELEKHCFSTLFGTADAKEGMKAFLEKREAKYEGK
jgi:enoyl-CoA hydratase